MIHREVRQKGCCIFLKWLWERYRLSFTNESGVSVIDDLIIVFGFLNHDYCVCYLKKKVETLMHELVWLIMNSQFIILLGGCVYKFLYLIAERLLLYCHGCHVIQT